MSIKITRRATASPYKKVVANRGGDYNVGASTDVSSTLTAAIASLTSGRTSVETVLLRGNFTINAHVVVPSYTRVILDGTITTTTLRPSGASNWSNNMGVFELGDRTSKPITYQASVEFTPGSKIIGDYFNTNASSYPQDKVNSAAAGFTDSTLLNQKDVCGVHSYCTLINCETVGVSVENMHGAVRFETLGRTNGTPSRGNRILRTRWRYTIIGIEAYTNGYESDSLLIKDSDGSYSIDDMIALVAADGGVNGATGLMKNVVIDGLTGAKNGLRGSAVKLDGGSMTSGLGQVRDITVSNVNVTTTQATLSGITPNENVTYLVLMGNTSSRNINYVSVAGSGNWRYGIRTDVSGVDLNFNNFYAESFYGCILKSPIAPADTQKVTLANCSFKERNYPSAEANSRGFAIMGGSGAQGFKNVTLRNVKFQGYEKPLVEEGISGLGTTGTITNVEYDIDIMDKALSDLVLASTNRRMNVKKLGQLIQREGGYVLTASCNTSTPLDATTYYFGDVYVLAQQTTADVQRIYFPKAGTITSARITFHQTAGTAETSTVSIRLNNTTDTTLSAAVTNDAANTTFLNSGLSIAVTTSDYIEIKWVTPTWATNPTNVRATAHILVE